MLLQDQQATQTTANSIQWMDQDLSWGKISSLQHFKHYQNGNI